MTMLLNKIANPNLNNSIVLEKREEKNLKFEFLMNSSSSKRPSRRYEN